MSREIKFRAFIGGKMEYELGDNPGDLQVTLIDDFFKETENVMQYTGIKDKNGIEIYEGDILRCENEWEDDNKWTTKVRFETCGFMIDVEGQDYNVTCIGFLDEETNIEVIGNIHQNPELIK